MRARPRPPTWVGSAIEIASSVARFGNPRCQTGRFRDSAFDFVAGEGEQEPTDPTRRPADALSGARRFAKVPVHRPLDRPDVVEPRLDLDDQQRSTRFVEREEVDPADIPTALDPNLPCHLPAGRLKAPLDVGGAQGVDGIVPTMIEHDGAFRDEIYVDPEAIKECPDDIEAGVGGRSLDLADHLTRDTGSFAQLRLGPPACLATVAHDRSDPNASADSPRGASSSRHGCDSSGGPCTAAYPTSRATVIGTNRTKERGPRVRSTDERRLRARSCESRR